MQVWTQSRLNLDRSSVTPQKAGEKKKTVETTQDKAMSSFGTEIFNMRSHPHLDDHIFEVRMVELSPLHSVQNDNH